MCVGGYVSEGVVVDVCVYRGCGCDDRGRQSPVCVGEYVSEGVVVVFDVCVCFVAVGVVMN